MFRTCNGFVGVVVPMPTLPSSLTIRAVAGPAEITSKRAEEVVVALDDAPTTNG